ncbi:hypothetical protein RHGRI_026195 [Rhododendron griersonianum]|uniref:Uncharacterized protein n=1 Tax=Rhododendron griersonianum TaxID=479676 RepID=A0AAV6IRT0_9ERIC|nr:hypothetical protein RHGRI_026195 [Rhododendron griersonianum]
MNELNATIVEEAGGVVFCMDGGIFCVFDRKAVSILSNGVLHAKLLERIGPATEKLKKGAICIHSAVTEFEKGK